MKPQFQNDGFVGREWVLQAVSSWLADPAAPRFFLLTGEPGSGKTAIASRLDQLSCGAAPAPVAGTPLPLGFLRAVHYCSERHATIDPTSFTKSLSRQLARAEPRFARALLDSSERPLTFNVQQNVKSAETVIGFAINNLNLSGMPPHAAFQKAVIEPLAAMESDGEGPMPSLTLLIDALDESLAAGRHSILDLMRMLDGVSPSVRLVVTSRPVSRVLAELGDRTTLSLSDDRGDRFSRADIARYIESRLKADPNLAGLLQTAGAGATGQILEKAAGNFLYARLLLDDLASGRITPGDIHRLPLGLDGLYYEGLRRASDSGGGAWAADAPLAGVLSVALEPLDRGQLQRLSGRPASAVTAFLGRLEQFIDESPAQGAQEEKYTLFHQSMRDFLHQTRLSFDAGTVPNAFFLDPKEWHDQIVRCYRSVDGWDQVAWNTVDDYGLRHLPRHMHGAGGAADVPRLVAGPFLAAKARRFHSYRVVRSDLVFALDAAAQSGDVPAALLLGLISAGLTVRSSAIDTDRLFPLYVLAGEIDRAFDLASMIQTPWKRDTTLRSIVATLAPLDPEQALDLSSRAFVPEAEAECLTLVYVALIRRDRSTGAHAPLLARILELVDASHQRDWRSLLLWNLSVSLRTIDFAESVTMMAAAIRTGGEIEDDQQRYLALRRTAQTLAVLQDEQAPGLYGEALDALERMRPGEWHAKQYREAIGELAALDLEGAIARSRGASSAFSKVMGLCSCSIRVAAGDLAQATKLLDEAANLLRRISIHEAEAWGWPSEVKKEVDTARELAAEVAAGRQAPSELRETEVVLQPRNWSKPPALPASVYRRRIAEALEADPGDPALEELVLWCAAAGDRPLAVRLIESVVRRSSRFSEEHWTVAARVALVAQMAAADLPAAMAVLEKWTGTERSRGFSAVIAAIAGSDLSKAISLRRFITIDEDDAAALAAILCAAAEAGEIAVLQRYEPRFLECDGSMALLDLKSNTLARLSGLVARHDLDVAEEKLKWALENLYGDEEEIGAAVARIGAVDPQRGLILLDAACRSYRAADMKGNDVIAEGLAALGRGAAAFAPDAALRVADSFRPFEPGSRAGIFAAVARALASQDSSRARDYHTRAIEEAERASTMWLKLDALLRIAEDCAYWDDAAAMELVDRVAAITRANHDGILPSEKFAKAASVALLTGNHAAAHTLLIEAAGSLDRDNADQSELEAIRAAFRQAPAETVVAAGIRIIQAVTEAGSISPSFSPMQEWLDSIVLCLIEAGCDDRSGFAAQLLREIDRAAAVGDSVFLG